MQIKFTLAFVSSLCLISASPTFSVAAPASNLVAREEKRDSGIYTYYAKPKKEKGKREEVEARSPQDFAEDTEKEKRDSGIYTYYAKPKKEKGKRDSGIYTYYAKPKKEKGKREEETMKA